MSNERLEEISERVIVDKAYYKYLDGTKGYWGKTYTLNEEDYNYLKERVQELEKLQSQSKLHLLNVIDNERDKNDVLVKRYNRYREVIESVKNKLDTVQYREYQTVDFRHEIFTELLEALEGEE